jgi:hypothetical protein
MDSRANERPQRVRLISRQTHALAYGGCARAVQSSRVELREALLSNRRTTTSWTVPQGQYLAFIHAYVVLNGRPPAEADMQRFFGVTPPSVHRMVVQLERKKLIRRVPGVARSIEVVVAAEQLPPLVPARRRT